MMEAERRRMVMSNRRRHYLCHDSRNQEKERRVAVVVVVAEEEEKRHTHRSSRRVGIIQCLWGAVECIIMSVYERLMKELMALCRLRETARRASCTPSSR